MAEPKQKSLELPAFLTRVVPLWQTPQWLEAERWRRVVRQQPVAIICRDSLIVYGQALPWEVRAKDSKEAAALEDDIAYYKDVLDHADDADFDTWFDRVWQDALDLPIGGNTEIVRWPIGRGPLSRPHAKGHVHKIVHVDGATLFPTYDAEYPMGQRVKGDLTHAVYFTRDELGRILLTPRPEIERKGYGMAPPERIFLAISLLYRGDTYYANLLLDTPEAGLLDLVDMSKEAAGEWIKSFRELFTGIDPMKIPVMYEHKTPAVWIPFIRPPVDMLYDTTTLKYARISAAGYWLALSDVGLEPAGAGSLAGQIRDERRARRTGYGLVKEKTANFINTCILPDYLEFGFIEKDEEALVERYRAFTMAAQAMKLAGDAGVMTAKERQAQLKKDGLITVEVEEPKEKPPAPPPPQFGIVPGVTGSSSGIQLPGNDLERVPPSQGGRGDLTQRGMGEDVGGVPAGSAAFDQLAGVLRPAFNDVLHRAGDAQLRKLVKKATRLLFPVAEEAVKQLADVEMADWLDERVAMWFHLPSEFDALPDVKKAGADAMIMLDEIMRQDRWWEIPETAAEAAQIALQLAYGEGATAGAEFVQEFLYTEGLSPNPNLVGMNFQLKNPETLRQIEESAALLVQRVNDGTRFYLKRIIFSGVEDGLASEAIAAKIREGVGVEDVLKEAGYTESVVRAARSELESMSRTRLDSIVNTEINKAETAGRLGQWDHMGLTRKAWKHTGEWDVCPICEANIELGFVPMDHMYDSVFGPATVAGPPAHPVVDHCHIEFDENELIANAGELTPWMGD